MGRRFSPAIALCCLALQASLLLADEWPGPKQTQAFSDDGERFVRILPGESIGDTVGFAGSAKGRYARAELYQRQPDRSYKLISEIELVNPVAPVEAMLSNSGALITFDNWHNAGYGKVIAIYSAAGKRLAAKELEDLYSAEHIAAVPASVSSRWWRCRPLGWSDPAEQTQVFVHEFRGGYFVFDLTDGSHRYESGSAPCKEN
jgi:hypothetical protein